ncbi:MAG: hypothetical protein DVB31_11590 [Verrucomicrobia bacterium]|nr:MAG: hypothetical protein DVB31_11590 [Verrucomicrobiota bacterium]
MASHSIFRLRCLLALAALAASKADALTFNFSTASFADSTTANAYKAAAQQAGAMWSSLFTDNITINVEIKYDTGTTGGSIANTAASFLSPIASYATVRAALVSDATTPDDLSATGHLQAGSTMVFGINRGTSGGPGWRLDTGVNSPTANNQTVLVPRAEAKAIGLLAANDAAPDFSIKLNSSMVDTFKYDLDRSNGIGTTQYDLVGVIAHEMGHGMGMQSLAEILSVSGAFTSEANMVPYLADLFRFSNRSVTASAGAFDTAADTTAKYFSVDGGTTPLANFALGGGTDPAFGNGQQANHWLDIALQPKIGIMDGIIGTGQLLEITPVDTRFFDVIGFDAVPETGTWAAGIALVAGALWSRRRSHR